MAVLSFTLALLMIIAGVRQLLHPWDLRHHAFFNGVHLPYAVPFWPCYAPHLCVCGYLWQPGVHNRACACRGPQRHLGICRRAAVRRKLHPDRLPFLQALLFAPLPCQRCALLWPQKNNTRADGAVLGHATSYHTYDTFIASSDTG